ncbi:ABC transporter permease [Clostridium sediminicola]|uniref:ABC transporter permease n=1 Tax=Clostridium sediminicola TaxID=3114879 RepID=UPI0031F2568A
MLNLIKLELKKFKIKGNIFAALICNVSILGLLCLIFFVERAERATTFNNYEALFGILGSIVNATFIIFAGVLISKFVIEEYKNKTIYLLFNYPISRKKLIIAKLIIISVFTFSFIVISNLLVFSCFYLIQIVTHTTLEELTFKLFLSGFTGVITSALANSMICLIPLYFGLRKKSTPVTIISSFLVASFLNSNNGGFTLSSIIAIPIAFMVIGIIIVYITIKDIDIKDVAV